MFGLSKIQPPSSFLYMRSWYFEVKCRTLYALYVYPVKFYHRTCPLLQPVNILEF